MPPAAPRESNDSMPVIVVTLAGRDAALPASMVESILPRPTLTPVGGAAPWLAGLMDHRGSLVPVVDGSLLLGAGPTAAELGSRVVLLRFPAPCADGTVGMARFGLLCSRARERAMLEVGDGAWRPGELGAIAQPMSVVGRIGDAPVMLLDPARLVATERLLAPAPTLRSLPSGAAP